MKDFFHKRKITKLIDISNILTFLRTKNSKKYSLTSRTNKYNKNFYNENITKNNYSGISFASKSELNDEIEDYNIFDYSLDRNKKRNKLRREANDPEIKDIEIMIKNLKNINNINPIKIKKTNSIKFSLNKKNNNKK